jgi:trk system potassium uptake protein TrkA
MKSFVVFGMGKFGQAVANRLIEGGADVMVVDNDEDVINQYSSKATAAIVADLTDPAVIKGLGISAMDCAVVAMGMSLEASIMCVMVSKECGIKKVVAKAGSRRMGKVLQRIGADEVIFPEEESGHRTARHLLSSNFLEFFDINEELAIVEMNPRPEWVGYSLKSLGLRQKYGANVIAIKDGIIEEYVDPERPLKADAPLLIMVHKKNVDRLDRRGSGKAKQEDKSKS